MEKNLERLINICLERNVPFVACRMPSQSKVTIWVQRSGSMQFVEDIGEVEGETGFVYAPFHRSTNFPVVLFKPEYIAEAGRITEETIREIEAADPMYPHYDQQVPEDVGRPEYLDQVAKMIGSFGKGLSKAVLSRVTLIEKPVTFDPGKFFLNLHRSYPGAFVHLINIPGAGCWTGATPELLYRYDGKEATTLALAGTRKRRGNIEETWGEKEKEEQEMVSVHVEQVLEQSGIAGYRKLGPETLNAGKVEHIATRYFFSPDTRSFSTSTFLKQLHPTPAVSGLPVDRALDLIYSTEKHNREFYAGYCGPLNHEGKTDLFVNLRCMKILDSHLAIFTGGGLTEKSVPEMEWEETQWKAKTLLTLI